MQVQYLGENGIKALLRYRLPIPKRLFAYTQTVVRLYSNDHSPIRKLKRTPAQASSIKSPYRYVPYLVGSSAVWAYRPWSTRSAVCGQSKG